MLGDVVISQTGLLLVRILSTFFLLPQPFTCKPTSISHPHFLTTSKYRFIFKCIGVVGQVDSLRVGCKFSMWTSLDGTEDLGLPTDQQTICSEP